MINLFFILFLFLWLHVRRVRTGRCLQTIWFSRTNCSPKLRRFILSIFLQQISIKGTLKFLRRCKLFARCTWRFKALKRRIDIPHSICWYCHQSLRLNLASLIIKLQRFTMIHGSVLSYCWLELGLLRYSVTSILLSWPSCFIIIHLETL